MGVGDGARVGAGDGVCDGAIRVAVGVGAGVRVGVGVAERWVGDGDGPGGEGEGRLIIAVGAGLVGVEALAAHPVRLRINASRPQRVFTIEALRRLFLV
jgi:hypothetical protein